MTDFHLILTKFTYLFIYLTFIEFLPCTKQHIFAKFNKIHERNKMLKKEITLISKVLPSGLQTGEMGKILLITYFRSNF